MKIMDLVRLKDSKRYKDSNLINNLHGIVVRIDNDDIDVMFFNPQNLGDYAIVKVEITDLEIEKIELPNDVKSKLLQEIDNLIFNSKHSIEPVQLHNYDKVELLVEDEKYSKFGIHKGDTGCIMDSCAVQNYIEVDFSGIDKNGNYYGDCISVKIEDLKVIK